MVESFTLFSQKNLICRYFGINLKGSVSVIVNLMRLRSKRGKIRDGTGAVIGETIWRTLNAERDTRVGCLHCMNTKKCPMKATNSIDG